MINVFTLTNVTTKIIGKLSENFISEVCIKLAAHRGTQEVARSFKKVGDPWDRIFKISLEYIRKN